MKKTMLLSAVLLVLGTFLALWPKIVMADKPDHSSLGNRVICPVSGKAFNITGELEKSAYIYKGKTYYFCCPMCKKPFEANPEKYLKEEAKEEVYQYIKDAEERIKQADWSKMETTIVELSEFSFSPKDLIFKMGVPYKLEIKNTGSIKHYFVSEKFYKAIATRKVQSNSDGEIKAPYFKAIEVFPGRSLDLYFIPVLKGTYDLKCTIKGHAEKGMIGTISIE